MIPLLVAGALALAASGPASIVDRRITDPRIVESSGLAVSPSHPGVVWTHDDSGNPPLLFALGPSGRVAATLRVAGVPDVDWEALAAIRDATGRSLLAVADIGDNLARRTSVEVDVVPEPSRLQDASATPLLRLRLRYPDGPRDAETLLVDPVRRRMIVVSKGLLGSTAYAVPAAAWDGIAPGRPTVRSATLVPLGAIPLMLVTDGTVAPSGAVLLRTYGDVAALDPLPADGGSRTLPPRATAALPAEPQGEGLALAPDGRSVLLSSEGAAQPVLRFPLPPGMRDVVAGSPSVSVSPPASPSPSPPASRSPAGGAAASASPAGGPSTRSSSARSSSARGGSRTGDDVLVGALVLTGGLLLAAAAVSRAARRRGRRSG